MDDSEEHVDVEMLMEQIRRQILESRAAAGDETAAQIPVRGKRFPPEFYEHLYLAGLAYNQLQLNLQSQPSRLPLVGPFLDRLKQALHLLVIFYVNQLAARQQGVNMHLLRALSILTEQLDQEQSSAARNT